MIAYEGKIIEIKDKGDLILVEFKNDFIKTFDNGDYSVEFKFSRSVYVRQHYALGLAIELFGLELLTPKNTTFRGRSLLDSRFSTDGNIIRRKCGNAIPWFNSQLNEQQKKAVYRVLKGDVLMPYLINGPPGKQSDFAAKLPSKLNLNSSKIRYGKDNDTSRNHFANYRTHSKQPNNYCNAKQQCGKPYHTALDHVKAIGFAPSATFALVQLFQSRCNSRRHQ